MGTATTLNASMIGVVSMPSSELTASRSGSGPTMPIRVRNTSPRQVRRCCAGSGARARGAAEREPGAGFSAGVSKQRPTSSWSRVIERGWLAVPVRHSVTRSGGAMVCVMSGSP